MRKILYDRRNAGFSCFLSPSLSLSLSLFSHTHTVLLISIRIRSVINKMNNFPFPLNSYSSILF